MTVQTETSQEATVAQGIILTAEAASKVKSLLEQQGEDGLALRVAVQPGGCSGLLYQLYFDDREVDGDLVQDFDGLNVVADRMCVPYLAGRDDRLRRLDREAGLHDRQPERRFDPAPAATPSAKPRDDPPGSARHPPEVSGGRGGG